MFYFPEKVDGLLLD